MRVQSRLGEKKDHTYNASSRLRSSSTSTLMVSGYVTVNVSVHGNEGSSAIVARIRSMAIFRERSLDSEEQELMTWSAPCCQFRPSVEA